MEWKRYANKYHWSWTDDPVYSHFAKSVHIVEMYDDEACIVEVAVKIHENQDRCHRVHNHPDYWGWLEKDDMVMIQPTWDSFNVQFAYGVRADEERGEGKAYRLAVEETAVVKPGPTGKPCA